MGGSRSRLVGNAYPSAVAAIGAVQRGFVPAGGLAGQQRRVDGPHHPRSVDRLHRPAEHARHLEQVGHAADVGGVVGASGVQQRRVEERGVAGIERQLDAARLEQLDHVGPTPRHVAGRELLRVREQLGRAARDRPVAVGDGALQRQQRRQQVGVAGERLGPVVGHEPEVVVAVRALRRAAGLDDVELRSDLVRRAEPRRRGEGDAVALVVVDEALGLGDRELLQRVPDPIVRAHHREVVARR